MGTSIKGEVLPLKKNNYVGHLLYKLRTSKRYNTELIHGVTYICTEK